MAKIQVVPKTDDATVAPGALLHLSEMRGYMIADPSPDVHGWTVKLRDGRTAGKVDDVIVDTSSLLVKYLEVKLSRDFRIEDEEEFILIPPHAVRLDESTDTAMIDRLPTVDLSLVARSRRGTAPRRTPTAAEVESAAEIFEIQIPEDSDIIDAVIENRPLHD